MFDDFLFGLRAHGLKIGLSEWLRFLRGLELGLATDVDALYHFGRAVLVHTEAHYDVYDLAFLACFRDIAGISARLEELAAWLENPKAFEEGRPPGEHAFQSLEKLLEAMKKTLEAQKERHQGGTRWVGTGGTSLYGTGGRATQGVQLGAGGGGRSGVRLADERRWRNYRTDLTIDVRDFKIALRALRKLAREGFEEIDVDQTIETTAKNDGDIDLVFRRARQNRVRVTLFMDSGGSMEPSAGLVGCLFTAASQTKSFKTFDAYYFHNAIYQWLYRDYETYERTKTHEVLNGLSPEQRLVFVGDASMAPWELFSRSVAIGRPGPSGLDWFRAFHQRCPASVWLNPDPPHGWNHPTVSAIAGVFPMYPLSLDGVRAAIQRLKKSAAG